MRLILCFLTVLGIAAGGVALRADAGEVGANKYDLLLQYTGRASGGDGSAAYLYVTRAMARKAIWDAKDAGITFFRVGASGFFPVEAGNPKPNDLTLWLTDPQGYWNLVDKMFDDLDRAGIRLVPCLIWNWTQFPAATDESDRILIRDPNSRSRALLEKYISDFIVRYRARKTILFYDLTNELNLAADLDLHADCLRRLKGQKLAKCGVTDHFTTAELIAFSRQMVAFIKQLDPERMVSSGYALPRRSAYHLEHRPEFSPKGADWTQDTIEQFDDILSRTQAPFDIVSIHVYQDLAAQDIRYGRPPDHEYEAINDASAVARAAHKKLFVGEFGDRGDSSLTPSILKALAAGTVDYAAVWVWEYYQFATNRSFDTEPSRLSLEPGFTDQRIAQFRNWSSRTSEEGSGESPPRVVLTWPLPCSRVESSADVSAVASGVPGDPVDHVDFLLNGKMIGTAHAPPFHVPFDPGPFGDNPGLLEARAISRKGHFSSFQSPLSLNRSSAHCVVDNN